MPAFRKNATGPKNAHRGPATASPAPSPAIVASSKRDEVRPRSASSLAVAMARNPRIDGTLAAVEAPSRKRVEPSSQRLVVRPVRITATSPKTGPSCITRWCPSRSESMPKTGERHSSETKNAAVRKLAELEPVDLLAAVLLQVGQVVDQQRPGQARAETEREGAEQDGRDGAVHRAGRVPRATLGREPRHPRRDQRPWPRPLGGRVARDWAEADRLRAQIEAAGWKVVDDGLRFRLSRAQPPDVVEAGPRPLRRVGGRSLAPGGAGHRHGQRGDPGDRLAGGPRARAGRAAGASRRPDTQVVVVADAPGRGAAEALTGVDRGDGRRGRLDQQPGSARRGR